MSEKLNLTLPLIEGEIVLPSMPMNDVCEKRRFDDAFDNLPEYLKTDMCLVLHSSSSYHADYDDTISLIHPEIVAGMVMLMETLIVQNAVEAQKA